MYSWCVCIHGESAVSYLTSLVPLPSRVRSLFLLFFSLPFFFLFPRCDYRICVNEYASLYVSDFLSGSSSFSSLSTTFAKTRFRTQSAKRACARRELTTNERLAPALRVNWLPSDAVGPNSERIASSCRHSHSSIILCAEFDFLQFYVLYVVCIAFAGNFCIFQF